MKRRSFVFGALLSVLPLAGCGDSSGSTDSKPSEETATAPTATAATTIEATTTTIEATTTTVDIVEADTKAIKALWRGFSDASQTSEEEARSFESTHNYPGTDTNIDQLTCPGDSGHGAEAILDQATIESDPNWVLPAGPLANQPLEGRIYIMTVHFVPIDGAGATDAEVHVAVRDDGNAYFFFSCS